MSGQIEQLALYDGRIVKIEGPARSGKTEVLVERCAHLLRSGVDPESILVVVSTDIAAQEFKKRLASAFEGSADGPDRVRVACAIDVCVEILDDPKARAITGRVPRILNDVEYRFFLEDLKTLGQKKQRLANMLAFFYAQWSKFEAEEDWAIPGEETSVLEHARKVCGLYGAMLRHETPYVCGRLLSSEEGKPFAQRYDYVFCDDFQNLSHAEQACMCLCAKKQVVVCGDPNAATEVNTEYPSAEGFLKFDRVRRGVETFKLESVYGIAGALRFGEGLSGAPESEVMPPRGIVGPGCALSVEWETPEQEFQGLVEMVRAMSEEGKPGEAPVVVVPTVRWGLFASRVLSQAGIASSTAGLRLGLGGDPRTPGRHDALSAYLRLRLLADPEDPLAWRAWGGLDNALTNSEMWESLQDAAIAEGVGLYDVVKAVGEGGGDSFPSLLKPAEVERVWKTGQDVIRECQGLSGAALAKAVGILDCPEFDGSIEVSDEDGPRDLCGRIQSALFRPSFPEDPAVVRIVLCECACGIECARMIVLGAVDGMMPSRDAFDVVESEEKRRKAKEADRRRLYSCISKATRLLVVSSFAKAGIETAERARIQVARVTSSKGQRIALVSPSVFLREAEGTCFEKLKGDEIIVERMLEG